MNILKLPPTREQIFGVTPEDYEECTRLDELLDQAFGVSAPVPLDEMTTIMLLLIGQLRRRVSDLERRLPPTHEG